jgi:DNA repair exonuclease SbcCD nuclease subunit
MCPRASIINKWGLKYPSRLENCIQSVNWLERIAEENNCTYVINLGDFFDKPDLSSETITACNELKWSNIMHYSLVGNHDASSSSLTFNSVNSFMGDKHTIIAEPQVIATPDCFICLLPYVVECDRKPLAEYFKTIDSDIPKIILSHNDIKGIQLGPVVSKTGFDIEEVEANCKLFINGHLHNGQALSTKIINLGNLTGKDFGEDAFKHSHNIAILDTETFELTFIENPFAFNFYKVQIDTDQDLKLIDMFKNNAVVSIKCDSTMLEKTKQKLAATSNIVEHRIIIIKNYDIASEETTDIDFSVDHLARFIECCKANIEDTVLLDEEISEICK